MQIDIINHVFNWNKERGLLEGFTPYSQSLESSFIAEELSELLRSDDLAEMADAHIDSIIFQLGALSKLLQHPQRVGEAFDIVLKANDQKSNKTDEDGKILKDRGSFIEPQKELQKLIDEVH